jgi:hypothetical protein
VSMQVLALVAVATHARMEVEIIAVRGFPDL